MINVFSQKGLSAWMRVAVVGSAIALPRENVTVPNKNLPAQGLISIAERMGLRVSVSHVIITNPSTYISQKAHLVTMLDRANYIPRKHEVKLLRQQKANKHE